MNDYAKYLENLTPEKRELFELLLMEKKAKEKTKDRIEPREDRNSHPLSFGQRRLWFLDQWEPESPAYNLPQAVLLEGKLNYDVLVTSLNKIVQRHESLRSRFIDEDGKPRLIIEPELVITIPVIDLGIYPETEQKEKVQTCINEEAMLPFNLAEGPLIRATLLHLNATKKIMLLTLHHIVSDGWSNGVLVNEIGIIYKTLVAGKPLTLPSLPVQYTDFAAWQQKYLQGDVLKKQLDYWEEQLKDAAPVLDLPTDRPHPPDQTYQGARYYFSIPKELTQAAKKLSREENASLYMVLLAAFKALLYRYTGQEDILVGSPIANRNRTEVEPLIGFFVNTIVMRSHISENLTFRELVRNVRRIALEAQDHQDLPFELMIEELNLERSMSHTPLFQVMFTLQNAPLPKLQTDELAITPLEIDPGTALFDISLDLYEIDNGLRGWFEYNLALFDKETVARWALHFNLLLKTLIDNPEIAVTDAEYLPEDEKLTLLGFFNAGKSIQQPLETVDRLFEEQVIKTPQNPAVVYNGQGLSYEKLNEKANQLAHYLKNREIGPGQFVCVCIPRSPELIIGILAVIKTGAVYVPLDPDYPEDRIRYIAEDTKAESIITRTPVADKLSCLSLPLVDIEQEKETIEKQPKNNLNTAVQPDDLIYVIYTSGSTGRPKGVMITHHNLASIYASWETAYQLKEGVRSHLQMAHVTFDVFNGDLVRALLSGGKLVICPREILLDPDTLYALLVEHQIECAEFVPVVLRNLIQSFKNTEKNLAFMKILICASDKWYGEDFINFKQYCGPKTQLINSYGLTEATIDSTYFNEQAIDLAPDQIIPIGNPFANTTCYILDQNMKPAPIGVPGELYIGGTGLARGYINQPQLTAEKFVDDPFAKEPGDRLYRTGDRARFLRSGNIEFLGRMDFQVKIRGFRIEPGEIEALLLQQRSVKEAAVVAHQEGSRDLRLIGYIVKNPEEDSTSEELRTYLSGKVPNYMVPSTFMFIDRMPLTPSGKINRRALPEPVNTRAGLTTVFVSPRTNTESILADIFSQVLQCEKVGIFDDFFTLGGHSLLAAQVMARINKTFHLGLSMRVLFDHTSISSLARRVDTEQSGEIIDQEKIPPIIPVSREKPLPLSFAQEQLWLIDQLAPGSAAYLIPATVRVRGPLDIDILQRCFDELIKRHEIFRTIYLRNGDEPHQIITPPFPFPLEIIDVSQADSPEDKAQEILEASSMQAVDMTKGPFFHGTLIRIEEQEYAFLLLMHHIVIDEWSSGILLSEIRELYDAYSTGRAPTLREQSLQYADYAYWQRKWLAGEVLESKLGFWRNHLADAPESLNLPLDYPRPNQQSFRGAYQLMPVGEATSKKLKDLATHKGVTIFMAFLAGFKAMLYRYSGQEDIIIGTPIANRGQMEVENMVGYFLNTLLIRTDLTNTPSFSELLRRVKETCLTAYAYQDIHFERLVQHLSPQRDMSRNTLFNVMFVHNPDFPMPEIDSGDIHVSYLPVSREVARMDLTMYLFDSYGGNNGFSIQFNYSTDIFKHETITRMMRSFVLLLEGMVDFPDRPIIDFPLLSRQEQKLIVHDWNATQTEYSRELTLHQLVEQQVDKAPDSVAAVYGDQSLTYGVLDQEANQLARHLQASGIKKGDCVAVYLSRSLVMLPALLGILKTGAAYVPLEIACPEERIVTILESLTVTHIITQESHLEKINSLLPRLPSLKNITCMNEEGATLSDDLVCSITIWRRSQWTKQLNTRPNMTVSSEQIAYIIFTSGSTGTPKGVMLQHKPVINLIQWVNKTFSMGPADRGLFITSLCFDLSVYDIFGILAAGGSLRIVSEHDLREPARLYNLLCGADITFWDSAPAALQQLAPLFNADSGKKSGLRLVFLSGDWIPLPLPGQITETFAGSQVISLGGATEAAIWSNYFPIKEIDKSWVSIPYGHPIQNARYYILDENLNPCPIGVHGDLYIGGECLAAGYANDPRLSASKFIPDPFSKAPGQVMYYTGDRARFFPDGNIEFLGRLDSQVKIRGYRIELGEIEAALSKHDSIENAVVLAPASKKNIRDRSLVAYIVTTDNLKVTTNDLQTFLKNKLPEYMVPSVFMFLDSLPVTSNGKLDRKALLELDYHAQERASEYIKPRNDVEEMILHIWKEVLEVKEIGIDDNFFEIGGHSLKAIQILSRLTDTFQTELPLRDLFENPTIREVARYLIDNEEETGQAERIASIWKQVETASEEELDEALTE